MKLQHVAQSWADGTISETDLVALPKEERAAMIADKDLLWRRPCGERIETKADAKVARTVSYVMSVEKGVGPSQDVILQSGWELDKFAKRGGPFLFGHNMLEMRPPLGRMSGLKKNGKASDGTRALTGDAEFTPLELNPFNDMIYRMVDEGFMPGGSVGFRILAARLPKTEAEIKKYGLGEYSMVIEQAELTEFSAVPIPMDADATKRMEAIHQRVLRGVQAGEFGSEQAEQLREMLGGKADRTTVTIPGMPFGVSVDRGVVTIGSPEVQALAEPEVLALLVPRSIGSLANARALVRDLGMSTRRATETDEHYRFVQHDADGSVQTITIDRKAGIRAELGQPKDETEGHAMDEKEYGELLTRVEALEAQNDELLERLESIESARAGDVPADGDASSGERSIYADVLGMTDEEFSAAFAGDSAATDTGTKQGN